VIFHTKYPKNFRASHPSINIILAYRLPWEFYMTCILIDLFSPEKYINKLTDCCGNFIVYHLNPDWSNCEFVLATRRPVFSLGVTCYFSRMTYFWSIVLFRCNDFIRSLYYFWTIPKTLIAQHCFCLRASTEITDQLVKWGMR
jgi:hypothetical protein